MKRNALTTATLMLYAGIGAAESGPARDRKDAATEVRELVGRMSRAVEQVKDYTATFTVQELVDDEMQPIETIYVKERESPRCAYLKWLAGRHKGREAIICEHRYDGKLKVREGSGVTRLLGTFSLDPHGSLAMKGNRHPVTEAGVFHPIALIERDFARAAKQPGDDVRIEGPEKQTVEDQPSLCWTATRSGEQPAYYAPKSHVCLHETLLLPTLVETWDSRSRLVERYTWSDFATNVGLTDADFDVENPDYGF
jgi:uncharacterized protein DUF1571